MLDDQSNLLKESRVASLIMRTVEFALGLKGKKSMLSDIAFRQKFERRDYPAPAPIPCALKRICNISESRIGNQRVITLTPKDNSSRKHIIYTHGGGYVSALVRPHWYIIKRLVQISGATVTVPLYALAPEYAYTVAYSLLERVYRDITAVTPADQVILCGDSAGGGLALGQALHYRDIGLPLPGRIILFSPWLDITMSNPEVAAVEGKDVMLARPGLIQAGLWWARGDDPRNQLLSPIFGDLSKLPVVDLFQGTNDIFIADARKLKTAIAAVGGTINLYEYPGAFHVFMAATLIPEAQDAFMKVAHALENVSLSSSSRTA
jgi:epsilon-lactone hydrolase